MNPKLPCTRTHMKKKTGITQDLVWGNFRQAEDGAQGGEGSGEQVREVKNLRNVERDCQCLRWGDSAALVAQTRW